jgi:hypothetical protein
LGLTRRLDRVGGIVAGALLDRSHETGVIHEERGLIGPGVAMLLVWIPLADALTCLLMPLTLIGAAKIPMALVGDALIVSPSFPEGTLPPRLNL